MKKIGFFIILLAMVSFATESIGAIRIVRKGDTLTELSRLTGYKVSELALMSEIKNPGRIYVGQKITFVSADDRLRAKVWAEKRRLELSPSDKNYAHFGWVLDDLKKNHLRFSINEYSGTHFSSILCLAKAQGKICRVSWKSNITAFEGHGDWSDEKTANIWANRRSPDISNWVECR
jgi:LysM repeat protein